MANANWNGGKSKGRAQAYARLRHNDPERRADPQVEHANREIDKSRTRLNFEVGPTAGMTYDEKRVRLDAILDKYGYPSDEDVRRITKNTPTSMQSIIINAPVSLSNDAALEDGSLKQWFEAAVDEAVKLFGEENIISCVVDVDEVHAYTDARTDQRRESRVHAHLAVAPVCEVKDVARQLVYLRPDGTETLDASEAQQVYITVNNSETSDIGRAARDEDGIAITGPKCARMKNGRRKYRKQKRSETARTTRKLSGSEFSSRENISALNAAIHKRSERDFGIKWNDHELGTYQHIPGDRHRTVEEMKAESVMRETAQAVADAEQHVADVMQSADAIVANAQAEAAKARVEKQQAEKDRDRAKRARDAYAGEKYTAKDGKEYLGAKGARKAAKKALEEKRAAEEERDRARSEKQKIIADAKAQATREINAQKLALDERKKKLDERENSIAPQEKEIEKKLMWVGIKEEYNRKQEDELFERRESLDAREKQIASIELKAQGRANRAQMLINDVRAVADDYENEKPTIVVDLGDRRMTMRELAEQAVACVVESLQQRAESEKKQINYTTSRNLLKLADYATRFASQLIADVSTWMAKHLFEDDLEGYWKKSKAKSQALHSELDEREASLRQFLNEPPIETRDAQPKTNDRTYNF